MRWLYSDRSILDPVEGSAEVSCFASASTAAIAAC